MPDLSTITQILQVGVEASGTPGTSVSASRVMSALDIDEKVMSNVDEFRPGGFKYPTVLAEEREWIEGSVKGAPTYSELIYPLSSLLTTVAPVEYLDTATHTNVYKWLFQPSTSAVDSPTTFTFESGNSIRAHKYSYGLFTDWNFNFTREKVEMGGKVLAQKLVDNISLTAQSTQATVGTTSASAVLTTATAAASFVGRSVSGTNIPANSYIASCSPGVSYTIANYVAGASPNATGTGSVTITFGAPSALNLIPVTGAQVSVFLDPTFGALGTTRLTRLFDGKLNIGNRYSAVWPVDSSQSSFVAHVETAVQGSFKAIVEADTQGMGTIYPLLQSSTTNFMRILCQGSTLYNAGIFAGGSALKYQLVIDLAVKVKSSGDFKDQQGVYAHETEFTIVHDAGWGRALQIQVDNLQSTLV